eukprot:SM000001S04728  [mRNA]  locus=s1:1897103:1899035:+ [translate_table: standard]
MQAAALELVLVELPRFRRSEAAALARALLASTTVGWWARRAATVLLEQLEEAAPPATAAAPLAAAWSYKGGDTMCAPAKRAKHRRNGPCRHCQLDATEGLPDWLARLTSIGLSQQEHAKLPFPWLVLSPITVPVVTLAEEGGRVQGPEGAQSEHENGCLHSGGDDVGSCRQQEGLLPAAAGDAIASKQGAEGGSEMKPQDELVAALSADLAARTRRLRAAKLAADEEDINDADMGTVITGDTLRDLAWLFTEAGDSQRDAVLAVVRPWDSPGDVPAHLCSTVLLGKDQRHGYSAAARAVHCLLLPRLWVLRWAPSRALADVLLSVARLHPRATVDAALLPLALGEAPLAAHAGPSLPPLDGGGLCRPQAELAGRISREALPADAAAHFLHSLLLAQALPARWCSAGGAAARQWSDAAVALLQALVSLRLPLKQEAADALARVLEAAAAELPACAKLGRLALTATGLYGSQLRRHRAALAAAFRHTSAFTARPVLAKLEQM